MGRLDPVPKTLFIGLVLVLLLTLIGIISPLPLRASQEADAWNKYPVPRKGAAGGWVLTSEATGVTAIAVAFDGTIYAATEEVAGSPLSGYNLFKSSNNGYSWTPLWRIPAGDDPNGDVKVVVLVLPRREDANILYLATQYNVYKSTNGGEKFTPVAGKPGGAGTDGLEITALDVTLFEDNYVAVVGVADISATILSSDIDDVVVSIPVLSTAGFKSAGIIRIENELISYTGKDATHFTGGVRGYSGTSATSHNSGEGVASLWNGEYGGVYFYDEARPFTPWTDLRVGGVTAGTKYDALAVAFSPNFVDDEQVVAVITDETDTIITTKVGISNWGSTIGDAVVSGLAAVGGSLAFPADYDSDASGDKYIQYVGLNDGGVGGGVYMIMGAESPSDSLAFPVFFPAPVHSIAAAGEAFGSTVVVGEGFDPTAVGAFTPAAVVAGLTNGSVVSIATGVAYTPPSAPPATDAYVAFGAFHGSGYFVYAGTSGTGGGFARSVDNGATFARTAFISDGLTTVTDLAVSPIYDKDSTMYMITEGDSGNHILWRTTNRGKTWDAVLTEDQRITDIDGSTETVGAFDKVAISPKFTSDTTIFVSESGNEPNIWRSTDNGFRFWVLPRAATTVVIDSWAIVGIKKVLVGDSLGNFYKTKNDGLTWSKAVATGLSGFSSMVLSPDYDNDHTILAGDDEGHVFRSTDDGGTWKEVTSGGFGGKDGEEVFVAFHLGYADNGIFFAAGDDDASNLVIDRYDNGWKTIFEGPAADTGNATGLVVSPDGTLYCTFFDDSDGMFRSLNPLEADIDDVEFEQVTEEISVALKALHLAAGSNVLLGFEDNDVYHYEDTLMVPVVLSGPGDGTSAERVDSVELKWNKLASAKRYEVEVNSDPGFKGADYGPESTTKLTSIRVTDLEDGLTYYWRARVAEGEPALSRWSNVWSFTTALGGGQWSPFTAPDGIAPIAGATSVPIRPTFAWNPADWAAGYELVVAKDSNFADVVTSRVDDNALSTPAWACDKDLDYDTTYYWKVRAVSPNSYSQWAVGIFTTEPASSASASAPPAPPAPLPVTETTISMWVMLAIVVLLVIGLLILIITTRRSY